MVKKNSVESMEVGNSFAQLLDAKWCPICGAKLTVEKVRGKQVGCKILLDKCVICGKPTVMSVYVREVARALYCHDGCIGELAKKYPNSFDLVADLEVLKCSTHGVMKCYLDHDPLVAAAVARACDSVGIVNLEEA